MENNKVIEPQEEYIPSPRILTIISGVLSILMGVGVCVLSVFVLIAAIEGSDPLALLASLGLIIIVYLILAAIVLALGIMWIGFGIALIRCGTVGPKEYSRRKGFIITTMVFDWLLIIGAIIAAFSVEDVSILFWIVSALNLVMFVFKVVDLTRFKNLVSSGKIALRTKAPTIIAADFAALSNLVNPNGKPAVKKEESKLEKKLKDIKALKDNNLINDEEYEKMRQKAIDEGM